MLNHSFSRLYLFGLCAVAMWSLGCQPETKPAPAPAADNQANAETHSHEHGPHGGPIFALGDASFAAEGLKNKTNNQVQIFLVKKDHPDDLYPVKADKIVIKTTLAGGKSFELLPVSPDADGKASEFSLVDADLAAMAASHPDVEIVVDGKTYTGKFDFH